MRPADDHRADKAPNLSVVVATRNRPARLAALLDSLEKQSLPAERFEVVVVDDASDPPVRDLLEGVASHNSLQLRWVRRERRGGPAAARNDGWRLAHAPLVAFTDDDCVASPQWAEAVLRAARDVPGGVIQGRLELNPAEMEHYNPFAHTFQIHELGAAYATGNIIYPRELLERLGGFDTDAFPITGEDTDLGWRAREAGTPAIFADQALMYHAVLRVGAVGRIRVAARQTNVVLNFKRHPELRRHLIGGVFWRYNHWLLARFLLALALPRSWGPVRLMLAAPYIVSLTNRRTGPLLAPYLIALDAAEVAAIARGALRYRVLIL